MDAAQEYSLDELGFLGRGKSKHRPRNDPALYGGDYPFIQTGDVRASELHITEYSDTYNEAGLEQSKLWKRGTLLITIAANIAETAILGIDACFPDSIVGFVPDEKKVNSYFIKYYIDYIKREMQSVSHGTTQDNLSLDKLRLFKFRVPSRLAMLDITDILLSYDRLIENNNRRIAILENMAQSLYREWFVNFRFPGHENCKFVDSPLGRVPEGWVYKKLSEVSDINKKQINSKKPPESIGYIDIASVSQGSIDLITQYQFSDAPGRARRIVGHGDILWSCVRPNRRSYALVMSPEENSVASTGFAIITAKTLPFSYLYFAVTTDAFVGYLVNSATGSAYPAVTAKDFEAAVVLNPSYAILDQFNFVVLPALMQCNTMRLRNENLKAQRDMLLPRLVSGQLEIKE